jgi:hypothetical protein
MEIKNTHFHWIKWRTSSPASEQHKHPDSHYEQIYGATELALANRRAQLPSDQSQACPQFQL